MILPLPPLRRLDPVSRQCQQGLHGFCKEPDTCQCADCHRSCSTCDRTNLQHLQPDGRCAECTRATADRSANRALCDNDPEHGFGFRNPGHRRNEYLCAACHAALGESLSLPPNVAARLIPICATADVSSDLHDWRHIKGNKFHCASCHTQKFDATARKAMR